jgi:hypothetical protein
LAREFYSVSIWSLRYHPAIHMLADHFFPQLLFFLLSQLAAFGLLRTGMVVWGFSVMILGWVLADMALVLHFVFPSQTTAYSLSLWGLQLLALTSFTVFFGWRWVRKREGFRAAQESRYSEALDHFMAGRDEEALQLFRRLSKRDPWDVEALLFQGRLSVGQCAERDSVPDKKSRGRATRRMALGLRLSGESPIAKEIEEEIRSLKRRVATPVTAEKERGRPAKRKRPARKAAS